MNSSTNSGSDRSSIRCKILWKLARMHTWSGYIDERDLLNAALDTEGHDAGRDVIKELRGEPFTVYQRGQGIQLKNDPDSQALVAFELRDDCNYTELQIEATLSRFFQAGGFAENDKPPDL